MERELLLELKRMKGVERKQPTPLTGRHYICRVKGIRYNQKLGAVGGNTSEKMILVLVVVSSQLISKSSLVFQIQPLQIRASKSMAIFHP